MSFMPIDLLPLKVELARVQYWKSPFGLIGMSSAENTDYAARKPRYDDGQSFAAGGWTLNLNPGGQLQVGPMVGFTSLLWSFVRIEPEVEVAERWVFEPYRGLVIGFEDRLFEHTSALLWQAMDGDDRALLRVGPVMRGKSSLVTPDQVLTVGGLVQTRPGTAPAMPTFMLVSTVYLIDPDYVGGPPWFAATATWESR